MRRSNKEASSGFTLVEVLLVIAIISLLATLSIPAIQSAREAARRTQCTNNMHQFGLAFTGVESQQGAFPAAFTARLAKTPVSTTPITPPTMWTPTTSRESS